MSFFRRKIRAAINERDLDEKLKIVGEHLDAFKEALKIRDQEDVKLKEYRQHMSDAAIAIAEAKYLRKNALVLKVNSANDHLKEAMKLMHDIESILIKELGVDHKYQE